MSATRASVKSQDGFIDALGGTDAVAELIAKACSVNMPPQHVIIMRQRGVPWRYRPALAAAAEKQGIDIPRGFLGYDPRRM